MNAMYAPQLSNLTSIRAMVKEYAAKIGMPETTLAGRPQGDGSPYVEVKDAYHFIVEERGIELERRQTRDIDELLYWIFDGVTFAMALESERRNRKAREDSRRQLFARQEALLDRLSAPWGERKLQEHARIIARYPFDDVPR